MNQAFVIFPAWNVPMSTSVCPHEYTEIVQDHIFTYLPVIL
jgi:hypothetical protein